MRLETVDCRTCGESFTAKPSDKRQYCSRKCANALAGKRRVLPDKICRGCGQTFRPRTATSVFCGITCRRAPAKACEHCGKSFPGSPPSQRFCSKECLFASRSRRVAVECLNCGASIQTQQGRPQKYCSRRCHALARGGKAVASDVGEVRYRRGYRWVRTEAGWRAEHRVIMEQLLDRPLSADENVHHINGVRDDNRPENLELWLTRQPVGIRVRDYHCPGCRCNDTSGY